MARVGRQREGAGWQVTRLHYLAPRGARDRHGQRAATADEIDDLAQRAQEGDQDALEAVLAAIRPRIFNVCRGVLPHTPDAEDACQEALINVATKIGSWKERRAIHHVAARRRGQLRALDVSPDEEPGHRHRSAEHQREQRPDPRTTSVIAGTRLDLLEAMETIEREHPQYVEPLLLRDVYGMSYEEIASAGRCAAGHDQGADPSRSQARAAVAAGHA